MGLNQRAPGGGIWNEDGNSPWNFTTRSGSHSLTLADEYDIWLLIADLDRNTSSNSQVALRVNGDSSLNYDSHLNDGTSTTGNSEYQQFHYVGNEDYRAVCFLDGRWNKNHSVRMVGGRDMVFGNNAGVASPLTSVKFIDISNTALKLPNVRMFGRDL